MEGAKKIRARGQQLIEDLPNWEIGKKLTSPQADKLNYAFVWSHSPQGNPYWHLLYRGDVPLREDHVDNLYEFFEVDRGPLDIKGYM